MKQQTVPKISILHPEVAIVHALCKVKHIHCINPSQLGKYKHETGP